MNTYAECGGALAPLRQYAEKHNVHILLPEAASLLETLVQMSQPKRILEIGTAIGYSGSLMLLSSSGSMLNTIEINEDVLTVAKQFFASLGLGERVTTHLGDARLIIPMFSGEYDLILADGAKSSYIELLPYLLRLLAVGGTLVCDNVLYKGWVLGDNTPPKRKHNTIIKNLDAFITAITKDTALSTTILKIGDGMSISVKKQ